MIHQQFWVILNIISILAQKGQTKSQLQVSVELFHLKAYFDEKPQRMYWRYLSATIHSCFLRTFHMHMNIHMHMHQI